YGAGLNSSLAHRDDGSGAFDSGWTLATFNVPLTAGQHTMMLGAFTNSANGNNETTTAFFDDINISFGGGVSGVLGNDTDADGNPLTASLVPASGPTNGQLTLNPTGSFTYTP